VGYNRDGIYTTWVAICSEGIRQRSDTQSSAMLYAWPKWAVYGVSVFGGAGAGGEGRARCRSMVLRLPSCPAHWSGL